MDDLTYGPEELFQPDGSLDPNSNRDVPMGIGVHRPSRTVRVAFGGPVNWIGLYSSSARAMAAALIRAADELDREVN